MHVLLRADQRLRRNHKHVLLPAHPQKLYLLGRELGPILNHKIIRSPIIQCQRNWSIFFVMVVTSTRWWSDWILENKRLSSEPFCVFSALVWWKVEEHHGKRRRKQEKISVLCWFFRRNSLPPSSPRSFRTQSCWSFITGQCIDTGRFLQVHLSRWMCNQFTFHHQFRIDTGRSKFEQTTDSILSACGSYGQRTQGSRDDRLGSTASCTVHP